MLDGFLDLAQLKQLDEWLVLIILLLVALGIGFIFAGLRRYWKGRFISGSLQGLSGICLLLTGFLLLSVAMNLYSYQRLGHERSIVRIVFEKTAPQRYLATLTRLDISSTVQYELLGDEWQLDARMLKWHSLANLFGLDALYRLERLSGRYHDVRDETGKPRSVYALHAQDPVDYWILMKKYNKYMPWVDAYYGSATYLPMADGARFVVSVTQSGLVARPVNEAARQKTASW